MTISEQAHALRAMVRHMLAGSVPDLIELRASLLARYPASYPAKTLAAIITHRISTVTEKN